MLSILATRIRAVTACGGLRAFRTALASRRVPVIAWALPLAVAVAVATAAAGHVELLHRMPIFSGAQAIGGVTEFLDSIKGYLLSIVLAGFTVAGIAVGAAKLTGHSRANDMIFNVGIGVAIFAALPTLVA
jgi:uncharacterized membrane protein